VPTQTTGATRILTMPATTIAAPAQLTQEHRNPFREHALACVARAADAFADVVCFPECYVPGYRTPASTLPPPDAAFLERAWSSVAAALRRPMTR